MYYTIFAKREENFLAKIDVAPLAGARIEMYLNGNEDQPELSLPSRERGLKFLHLAFLIRRKLSLPSRERGLKFAQAVQYTPQA